MNTVLTESRRDVIARLAAAILPGTKCQPAALEIDIESRAIDRALTSRPDLAAEFCQLLDRFEGDPEEFLQVLPETDFNLLLTLICAAYLMDESVKKALGYYGQQALTPNRGGFGAEDLVIEMMQQPKRYREV
jgi:hypothetical protein